MCIKSPHPIFLSLFPTFSFTIQTPALKMLSNKLFLIALMGVALVAGAVDAAVLPQKRATCLPLGSSCSVIPNVNGPRCCNFLVCDFKNTRCKSGLVIN